MRELKYDLERNAEFDEVRKLQQDISNKSISEFSKSIDEEVGIDDRIHIDDK